MDGWMVMMCTVVFIQNEHILMKTLCFSWIIWLKMRHFLMTNDFCLSVYPLQHVRLNCAACLPPPISVSVLGGKIVIRYKYVFFFFLSCGHLSAISQPVLTLDHSLPSQTLRDEINMADRKLLVNWGINKRQPLHWPVCGRAQGRPFTALLQPRVSL